LIIPKLIRNSLDCALVSSLGMFGWFTATKKSSTTKTRKNIRNVQWIHIKKTKKKHKGEKRLKTKNREYPNIST